jgi:hypothetical protein
MFEFCISRTLSPPFFEFNHTFSSCCNSALLRLVGCSVRRARGWGNPEVNNEITEVCPDDEGRTMEQR